MNLSKDMQKVFTDEIDFVVKRMKESKDMPTKLYFFSAVYGTASRIMNIEFDPELAFIHHVLNFAYSTINARSAAISGRQEQGAGIPEKLFDRLEEALEELVAKILQGKKTYPVLETISNLAYSTTGNGYYLYMKGLLPV
jgi:hypothetical protein